MDAPNFPSASLSIVNASSPVAAQTFKLGAVLARLAGAILPPCFLPFEKINRSRRRSLSDASWTTRPRFLFPDLASRKNKLSDFFDRNSSPICLTLQLRWRPSRLTWWPS